MLLFLTVLQPFRCQCVLCVKEFLFNSDRPRRESSYESTLQTTFGPVEFKDNLDLLDEVPTASFCSLVFFIDLIKLYLKILAKIP